MLKTASGVLLTFLFALDASAQNDRKVGLVLAGPASVGVEWRLNDKFSIRPDVSATWSSSTTTTAGAPPLPAGANSVSFTAASTSISSNASLNVGVAALVTVKTWDHLQVYVAPRAGVFRSSIRSRYDSDDVIFTTPGNPPFTLPGHHVDESLTNYSWSGAASLGVRHSLSDRFSLFGETGITYSRASDSILSISVAGSTIHPSPFRHTFISTHSSIGVVWFF